MKKIAVLLFLSILVISLTITGISCKAAADENVSEKVAEETTAKVVAGEQLTFVLISDGTEADPFYGIIEKGVQDAAAALGVKANQQFAGGDIPKQVNFVEAAIAAKVDGIGLAVSDGKAFDEVVQKALDAGIPVIGFNIDDPEGAAGNPRLAYIGQDLVASGIAIGNYMAKLLKSGDFVMCPVEVPGLYYAQGRYKGVKQALDAAGIKSEMVDVGYESQSSVLAKMEAYLQGHPETVATLPLGALVAEVAPLALEEMKIQDKVINGGFDFSEKIANDIKQGKTKAGVDQQGYCQGFYTVAELWTTVAKHLQPMDINTGMVIVDPTNVEEISKQFE